MRATVACAVILGAGVLTAAAGSAAGVRFTSVEHDGFGPVLTSHFGNANVTIVTSITGAGSAGPFNLGAYRWAQKLNWNAWFAVSAAVITPTTGYKLSIKRITIQRVSSKLRQLCVIAALESPAENAPVLQRKAWALHVVKLSRRAVTGRLPQVAVLRRVDGKLLAKGYTTEPTNPVAGPIPPPAAALCRA